MLTDQYDGDGEEQAVVQKPAPFRNKNKLLIVSSRGIGYRIRHLMQDFIDLCPHSKKDVKIAEKSRLESVNEVCEMKGCNLAMFFEARKGKDFYLWLARSPDGPSMKFHMLNIHTSQELRMTGNCLKGSRPLLYFDKGFDQSPEMKVAKELLQQTFNVPRGHHKSKPFIDHVMGFYLIDGRIWMRNFQISHMRESASPEPVLAEIGPRCVLNPVRMFGGAFGGPTLWENQAFVSPNEVRSMERQKKGDKYSGRLANQQKRKARREESAPGPDPLGDVFAGS